MPALHRHLLAELGLTSLYACPRDVKLLILQRFSRFFAFGGSTIVLALYLHALHVSDARIGLFMTLALVGDVVSFALTVCADGVGRRRVLTLGAGLMAASGLVLAWSDSFGLLIVAAVVGVLSPKYAFRAVLDAFFDGGERVCRADESEFIVDERSAPSVRLKSLRLRSSRLRLFEATSLLGMP